MNVRFYIPKAHLPSAEKQSAWLEGGRVVLEAGGKLATAQSWIFQTWAALKTAGVETELVHDLPRDGILITLAGCLPARFSAPKGLFVAEVVADGLPNPGAHIHILQNSLHARKLRASLFMPHWPQPGIVPRDVRRQADFSRIAFFGDPGNLAPELRGRQWNEELVAKCGARLEIRDTAKWHDYSDIDAVMGVRDFSGRGHLRKPATKLYNAWLAGVPFIGGVESALASDGRPGVDHLAASSAEQVMACAVLLAGDTALRESLVIQGRESAKQFSHQATLARWRSLVTEVLPETARRMQSHSRFRRALARRENSICVWFDRTLK
jgi:hypothetical protein